MFDKKALSRAVWDLDGRIDEGHQLYDVLGSLVDVDAAMHMAQQRALRIVLAQRGGTINSTVRRAAYEGTTLPVDLSESERETVGIMAAVWLDGLSVALKMNSTKGT